MQNMKARKVYPLDGLVIGVLFADGTFKKYDLEPLCKKWPVFKSLYHRDLFETAHIEAGGYGIVWNEDVDIAAEEIYLHGTEWPDAPRQDAPVAELVAQFRELRKAAKLTQQDVSNKTGIQQANIARMENGGRTPNLETLLQLGKALGYTLEWKRQP